MSAVYRAKASGSSSAVGPSMTVTLDASTVAGDTAVAFLDHDASITATVSGLGATWTKLQTSSWAGGPLELWVGTGCTASQTVITVSFSPNDGCDVVAIVFGGAPVALSAGAITVATTANPVAPNQTATSSAGDQVVVNLFMANGNPTPTGFSDSPAAFTTETNAGVTSWQNLRLVSAYRIPAETGAEARTVNLPSSVVTMSASVLLGQAPAATARRHTPITVARSLFASSGLR